MDGADSIPAIPGDCTGRSRGAAIPEACAPAQGRSARVAPAAGGSGRRRERSPRLRSSDPDAAQHRHNQPRPRATSIRRRPALAPSTRRASRRRLPASAWICIGTTQSGCADGDHRVGHGVRERLRGCPRRTRFVAPYEHTTDVGVAVCGVRAASVARVHLAEEALSTCLRPARRLARGSAAFDDAHVGWPARAPQPLRRLGRRRDHNGVGARRARRNRISFVAARGRRPATRLLRAARTCCQIHGPTNTCSPATRLRRRGRCGHSNR